jgi:hypothetical protein
MTEHVHQQAQLIVRDTALALRTNSVCGVEAERPTAGARFGWVSGSGGWERKLRSHPGGC